MEAVIKVSCFHLGGFWLEPSAAEHDKASLGKELTKVLESEVAACIFLIETGLV
jgi:hypothetical protein